MSLAARIAALILAWLGATGAPAWADEPIELAVPGAAAAPSSPREAESRPLPPPPPQERLPVGPIDSVLGGAGSDRAAPTGGWFVQTIVALAIVIGLIFALRAVLKKLSGQTIAAAGAGRLVEVLARTPIGHKTQILFLRVHHRILIVAQSPAGLHRLDALTEGEDLAWVLAQAEAARRGSIAQGFSQLLAGFDQQFDDGDAEEEDGATLDVADAEASAPQVFTGAARDELAGLRHRIRAMMDDAPETEDVEEVRA